MTALKLKTDDRRFGDSLGKFRVRVSAEFAFSLTVEAHNEKEAALVAENFCEATGGDWWQRFAEHVHKSFEPEAINTGHKEG